jgi:hypothetical protein
MLLFFWYVAVLGITELISAGVQFTKNQTTEPSLRIICHKQAKRRYENNGLVKAVFTCVELEAVQNNGNTCDFY